MIYLQIVVCAAAALLIINMLLLAPGNLPKNTEGLWRALYAHRGLHTQDKKTPENSLAAFEAAVKAGYGIELDVCLSADGKVVVFHDDDLKRICGVEKKVEDCTFEELLSCRLLGTDERIPLFSEVLMLVGGRQPMIVELKTTRRYRELCKKTADLLEAYKGMYCVESFDPRIVHWFRKFRPLTVRGQLSAGRESYKGKPFYQAFLLSGLFTNIAARPHFAAYKHEDAKPLKLGLYRMLGGKLVGWTVRDTDNAERLMKYFDTIIFEFFEPKRMM